MEPRGEGHLLSGDLATPMMKQYQRIKASHPDAILFFRLGDFYEMFFEDAEIGAKELEITLTSRTTGNGLRTPMCGVPYHAADAYVSRLVEKGYKVAVCDQVEDPNLAKGLVRREVVRVVTPGTVLDPAALPEKGNNYIVSISARPGRGRAGESQGVPGGAPQGPEPGVAGRFGLACLDYSTGEFRAVEYEGPGAVSALADELACLEPAEAVVHPAAGENPELACVLRDTLGRPPSPYHDNAFRPAEAGRVLLEHFGTVSLEAYGCADKPLAVAAAGGLLAYLRENKVGTLEHIRALTTSAGGEVMALDGATRRNLELVEPLRPGSGLAFGQPAGSGAGTRGRGRQGTLLGILDHTVTSGGGRLLRSWTLRPLLRLEAIRARQEAVAELADRNLEREELRSLLKKVYDLERLVARAAAGTAGARDMLALRDSLAVVPAVAEALSGAAAGLLSQLAGALDPVEDLTGLISRALSDDPPSGLKEGGLVRPGYSSEVDELRESAGGGKAWVAGLEAEERRKTGIKSLKVGFNQVFGYYIEVTRPNLALVPPEYQRRQTLANAERFITPELKEREAVILGAEERLKELEYDIFCGVRSEAGAAAQRIQATAGSLATLDALLSLAEAGSRYGYVVPEVVQSPGLRMKGGRHPVVERLWMDEEFVPNDCSLGAGEPAFAIITGPNMAGKSTFCRQVALIVVMAQMGGMVPADEARIGLVDRVFTRIGSSDELSGGRSTFLVEMSETANILGHATDRSLIILDEIGRGTSTYDGLSLAWAVSEYIVGQIGAMTLFATHYHELVELEAGLEGVANYSISVREVGDDIVFLRKVARGPVDRSYGIQVARLAGLPEVVIARARDILYQLEGTAAARRETAASASASGAGGSPRGPGPSSRGSRPGGGRQMVLFEAAPSEIEREIAQLDLMNLTPLEALNTLHRLQEELRKGRSRD